MKSQDSRRLWRLAQVAVVILAMWLISAYMIVPLLWSTYESRLPIQDDDPRITETGDHHPGDPLNVALVGTAAELDVIMRAAHWYPATTLGLESDLKIAEDTVLSRPDPDAPVSNLFLFGRKEDKAFEQPVGGNPRHRHHVRFWKADVTAQDGRPVWIGSAVYDQRVGLSHTTGQITHVTAPQVDRERDYLFECLEHTGKLAEHFSQAGFHKQLEGRNGGGDLWQTDGALYVGIIESVGESADARRDGNAKIE